MNSYEQVKKLLSSEPRIEVTLRERGVWGIFEANLESGNDARIEIALETAQTIAMLLAMGM